MSTILTSLLFVNGGASGAIGYNIAYGNVNLGFDPTMLRILFGIIGGYIVLCLFVSIIFDDSKHKVIQGLVAAVIIVALCLMFHHKDTKPCKEYVITEKIENTICSEEHVPAWLGNPVSAKHTRVQRNRDEKMIDMVVFTYQNGVVMAPNGKVDMNLIYAFDATVASKNGVETCLKNASYSGVWTGSKWAPAGITITSGRWIYAGKNASWDHTVMFGVGTDVTPTPKSQSYKIDGNKIAIKYETMNT